MLMQMCRQPSFLARLRAHVVRNEVRDTFSLLLTAAAVVQSRGVDVYKRTVTTHSLACYKGYDFATI